MKHIITAVLPVVAILTGGFNTFGQVQLTDVTVFSANEAGAYDGNPSSWDCWNTRDMDSYANAWIQDNTGVFVNAAAVRPNVPLEVGETQFRLFLSPGADWPHFGVNVFLNGSSAPAISAVCPLRLADGPTPFWVNTNQTTLRTGPFDTVRAAGTLRYVHRDKLITLTDFYIARPDVYKLDLVGPDTIGANGAVEYVAGLKLKISELPKIAIRVSEIEFSWPTELNQKYQVEYRSPDNTNLWITVTDPIDGTGTNYVFKTAVSAEESGRFYRVMLLP